MKKKLFAIAMTVAASSAFAQSSYFGIEGGAAFADIKADETAQYLANVSGRTTSYTYDKATGVARIYYGTNIAKNVDVEIGYFKTSDLKASYSNSLGTANEKYSAYGLDLSAVYRPEPTGLFFKAGVHQSKIDGNARVTVGSYSATGAGSESGAGLLLGLGYDAKLSNDLYWHTAFTHMNKVAGEINVNVLTLGISKKF
jgi:Outer membrane protein beta-barrel domain